MITYTAHVIDNSLKLHAVTVHAESYRTVKAQARKIAKAQGITVRYIESMHISG